MPRRRAFRVLIIEDSALMARELHRALQAHPRLSVVGVAHDGRAGLELVRKTHPDVVTLDVHMPEMDGITCLQHIMIEHPTPCVVVSALTGESALETFEAYELGAVDVVEKPTLDSPERMKLFKRRLAAKLVRASHADVSNLSRFIPETRPPKSAPYRRPPVAIPRQLVVIGVSTGGPRTLMGVLPQLPADFSAPVIVVQHMPGSFTASFAERMDQYCELHVKEAEPGEQLQAGTIYIAPGDYHLSLGRKSAGVKSEIVLIPPDGETAIVPSVDVAMKSCLEIFGHKMIGVLLTGLGEDGAEAMELVHEAGGVTIAESEDSAVIYGMPRAAVERGCVDHVLPARKIAARIVAEVERNGAERG